MKVYRFEVPVDDQAHRLSLAGPIVHVATRRLDLVEVWAETQAGLPIVPRYYQAFGTGQDIPDGSIYIGTAILPSGFLVWHLYEVAQ